MTKQFHSHMAMPGTREEAWCGSSSHRVVKTPACVSCPKCKARMVKAEKNYLKALPKWKPFTQDSCLACGENDCVNGGLDIDGIDSPCTRV